MVAFNEETGGEMIHAIDFEGELYTRQEGKGMLIGTYEQACKPWSPVETPWDFGPELLEPDLDRLAPSLEIGFAHFPPLERAGIKQIVNGPFTFAPDGNPLVGPIRGLSNFWVACGVMAGFSQGGGVGLALSSWMIDGDPGLDIFAMDVARFGDFATMAYTNAKVRENYSRRFSIRFPNEELPAATAWHPVQSRTIFRWTWWENGPGSAPDATQAPRAVSRAIRCRRFAKSCCRRPRKPEGCRRVAPSGAPVAC